VQQGRHYTYREGKFYTYFLYGCFSFARKNMDRNHTQNGSTQMYAKWGLPAHPFASSGPRRRPQNYRAAHARRESQSLGASPLTVVSSSEAMTSSSCSAV